MKELLRDILNILNRLNEYTNNDIVNPKSINEEYDNLNDFDELCSRIKTELNKLDQASSFNRNETRQSLSTLRILIMDYYWHIDQPKIMIETFIGKYRDCIHKKELANDDE